MTNTTSKNPITSRRPDCITEVRMGNTILTVSGYFKQDAIETSADKMMRVLSAENAANLYSIQQKRIMCCLYICDNPQIGKSSF